MSWFTEIGNTYILQRSHTFTDSVGVLRELLSGPLQDALRLLVILLRWRVNNAYTVLPLLALTVVDHLGHETSVHGRVEHAGTTSKFLLAIVRGCR